MHRKTFNIALKMQRRLIHIYVVHDSARAAHHVVVVVNIGVKANCPRTQIDVLHFTHGAQFRQGLVHRAQRDARHLLCSNLVQRFCRGVCRVAIEQAENKLALWGDFKPLVAKAGYELFW